MAAKTLFKIISIFILLSPFSAQGLASSFPVSIESCGRTVTLEKAPQRLITHDINITEIALSLNLQNKLVGVTGISGWNKFTPKFQKKIGTNVKELSKKYPSLEVILDADPDFVFAGWNYGFNSTSDFNPESLAKFNIKSYELKESCVHIGKKNKKASIQDLYDDTLAIGYAFGVGEKAEAVVADYKKQLQYIKNGISKTSKPLKVFVFDDIADAPLTSGGYGMPNALIEAAGGINSMASIDKSWTRVSWESIAISNPDAYIIVDYGANSAKVKINYLKNLSAIAHTGGIKNNRFIILDYNEVTPSPRNIKAIEKISIVLQSKK